MEAGAQISLVTGIRGSFPLKPIFLLQYREGLKPTGNNVNADRLIEICLLDQGSTLLVQAVRRPQKAFGESPPKWKREADPEPQPAGPREVGRWEVSPSLSSQVATSFPHEIFRQCHRSRIARLSPRIDFYVIWGLELCGCGSPRSDGTHWLDISVLKIPFRYWWWKGDILQLRPSFGGRDDQP